MKNTLSKYYISIDEMPLYNWHKCNAGELNYVFLDPAEQGTEEQKNEIFDNIYQTYIDQFGISKDYKNLLEIMKKKAILQCNYIETKDRFKLTEIEIQDAKLEAYKKKNSNPTSLEKTLIKLSKFMGFRLNWKEITVTEYFNILDQYGKAN
jgi:hypothetical protein